MSPPSPTTILFFFQRKRGQWVVYYTSPQIIIKMFSYSLAFQLWALQLILICCFIKLKVQTFQPIILIYRNGDFVYNHWGSTSIYQPLSYPFRSLFFLKRLCIIGVGPVSQNYPIDNQQILNSFINMLLAQSWRKSCFLM